MLTKTNLSSNRTPKICLQI